MAGNRHNLSNRRIVDENGTVGAGWKANYYITGTSTRLDTYSDKDLTAANANPVEADPTGRFGDIFLKQQSYKVVLTDENDVGTNGYTINDVSNVVQLDVTGTPNVDTKAALSALDVSGFTATTIYDVKGRATTGDGYEGRFRWVTTDQSANVTIDTEGGVWVAPASASTGASGAWKRMYLGNLMLQWFISTDDDTLALQAAQGLSELDGASVELPLGQTVVTASVTSSDSKTVNWVANSNGGANAGTDPLGGTDKKLSEIKFTGVATDDQLLKCGAQVHIQLRGIHFSTTDNTKIWHGIQIADRGILSGVSGAANRTHQGSGAGRFLIANCSYEDFGGTAIIGGGELFGSLVENDFKNNAQHVDIEGGGETILDRNQFEELLNTSYAPRTVTGGGPYPAVYTYATDATRNAGVYLARAVIRLNNNIFVATLDKTMLKLESCNVVTWDGTTLERPGNTAMTTDALVCNNDGTSNLDGKSMHISGGHILATSATGAIAGRLIKFTGTSPVFRTFSIRDCGMGYGVGVDDYLPLIDCTSAKPAEIEYASNMTDHARSPLLGFAAAENDDGTSWLAGVKGADISFHTVTLPTFTVLAGQTDTEAGTLGINSVFFYKGHGAMYLPVQIDVDADTALGSGTAGVKFYVSRDLIAAASGTHDGSSGAAVLTDSGASFTPGELIGTTVFNITDGSSGTVTANTATTVTATLAGGTDDDWDASDAYRFAGDRVDMTSLQHGTAICALRSQYMINTRTDTAHSMQIKYDSGSAASTSIVYKISVTYAVVRAYNRGGTPAISDLYVGTSAPLS